jgi:hypothetical protein
MEVPPSVTMKRPAVARQLSANCLKDGAMRRGDLVALLVMALAAACPFLPAGAETKYKPCSLLTAAELEGALRGKVARANEKGSTIPDGPFKSEIMSTCDWVVGSSAVTLSVMRGPQNPLEQAIGVAALPGDRGEAQAARVDGRAREHSRGGLRVPEAPGERTHGTSGVVVRDGEQGSRVLARRQRQGLRDRPAGEGPRR